MKNNILKYARVICAVVMMLSIVTLFCDTTGIARHYLGWCVKIQFFPSLTAGFIAAFLSILVVTKLFGRVYCSIICPLGIFQDIIARFGKVTKKQKMKYSYSEEKLWLRLVIAVLFIASFFLCSIPFVKMFESLLEPYSIFGRIATTLLTPVGRLIAEHLAASSEAAGNYTFAMPAELNYSYVMLGVALFSLVFIAILAFRGGRTYCNTICPVGTILSLFAENSIFKPVIDDNKCKHCGLCARKCKASCINSNKGIVDSSRCVDCMNCLFACRHGAISFTTASTKDKTHNIIKRIKDSFNKKKTVKAENSNVGTDESKRAFLTIGAILTGGAMTKGMAKTFDGGLAEITEKKEPQRTDRITPPGSKSYKNIEDKCTSCGLCITACPNGVLRPSESLDSMLTPVMSFEKGYCRPECKRCSDVCPTGAISLADLAEKSATHVGHAVLIADNCVSMKKGVTCGNCARHCPAGAITMAPTVSGDETSAKMPVIDSQRCIGCGACENLCPSSPYSAIYVEGHRVHRID